VVPGGGKSCQCQAVNCVRRTRRPSIFRIRVQQFCAGCMRNQHCDGAVQNIVDRGAASLGSPDMNGLQADEAEKLQREALIKVGKGLRDHYDDVLTEAIPNRLADLLRRLVAANEARCRER
jgi:hypothetical protein